MVASAHPAAAVGLWLAHRALGHGSGAFYLHIILSRWSSEVPVDPSKQLRDITSSGSETMAVAGTRVATPCFSIITPSFRSSAWLKLCLASVADQGIPLEH